ncbi:polysaccharide deacetylase family protein [Actinocorallia libanotica]|uniref:NodB homology domain-containing protein n=1 Tax=Actinocorallia libanotica TaxID=46162 RepID=A0ABN1QE40_9ACTN
MRMKAVSAAILGIATWLSLCAPAAAAAPAQKRVNCARVKCVALTFDDGPSAGTARLLTALRRSGARATFFVVGDQARARPGLVARAHAEGHEIGDHTEHHPQLTGLPSGRIHQEIDGTRRTIARLTGARPVLLRPPYGATDGRVAAQARRLGLAQVLWDVDTLDWRDRDHAVVARRAVRGLHRGAIILMHDSRPTTVAAVPAVLRAARAKGYALVTVSELLGSTSPGKVYRSGRR